MKVLCFCMLAYGLVSLARAQGAGRAIPIASENFVIDLFKTINPSIEYDPTNFLVDLSGNFANCNFIGRRLHQAIDRRSPNEETIGLIQDYTRGDETHTKAVDGYIRPVFENWIRTNQISTAYGQIERARRFGCSVRPGCRGEVSVACLFTPYSGFIPPAIRSTARPTPAPTTTRPTLPPNPPGEQRAKAFTPEQYAEAERLSEMVWDRSHFLENLSGYETRCEMLGREHDWSFDYSRREAAIRGKDVVPLIGTARNRGSTPDALLEILENMKEDAYAMLDKDYGAKLVSFFDPDFRMTRNELENFASKEVGCSLIPDCVIGERFGTEMWVVVSCLFEV